MPIRRPRMLSTHTALDAQDSKFSSLTQQEFDRLRQDVEKLRDGRLAGHINASTLPVMAGAKGDFIKYDSPTLNADGSILLGWICTVSGDPATWEEVQTGGGGGGGGASIYDIVGMYNGIPPDSVQVLRFPAVRAYTLPLNLVGSYAYCQVAPTATTTFTIYVDDTSVGTINFAASASSATFDLDPAVTVAVGELIEIEAPAMGDDTFEGLSFCIKATL